MTGADQGPPEGHDRIGSVGQEAAKLFGALSGWARDLDDHLATGAAECTYCPICRTVHVFREAGPEVRTHLASAAASLMQAAAAVLTAASSAPTDDRSGGVENIDLDGSEDWPETEQPEEKQ